MTQAQKFARANFYRAQTLLESSAAIFIHFLLPILHSLLLILYLVKYNYCFLIIIFESSRAKRAIFFCQNQVERYQKS